MDIDTTDIEDQIADLNEELRDNEARADQTRWRLSEQGFDGDDNPLAQLRAEHAGLRERRAALLKALAAFRGANENS
jgi:predicted  nucleic acid-binding Zn-ribbon protein